MEKKDITKEEKEKYKAFFEDETGVFIIEKLTSDINERCKLPEVIELRKKLGYNHDDIMIREETSIAEKIIKLFPKENIKLNNKFNNRKLDIWFKDYNIIIEVMKEIMKIMIQMMKKEKICLKSIILKFFIVIQMILILIFLNF